MEASISRRDNALDMRARRLRRALACVACVACVAACVTVVGASSDALKDVTERVGAPNSSPKRSSERYVLQTTRGDLTLALYDDEEENVAPLTIAHVREMLKLGMYATNHVFRIDKGFVAQIADVKGGRRAAMNTAQTRLAEKTVKGEFKNQPKHSRGRLSMARWDDPDSATSSFSVLLGDAPHLDGKYAVFGEVVGEESEATLRRLEAMETKREGIFVMPKERVEILATYVVEGGQCGGDEPEDGDCRDELRACTERADSLAKELHEIRSARLPGN